MNGEVNVLDSQMTKRFYNRGQESNLIDKDFFIFSRVSLGFFLSHDKSHDVTLGVEKGSKQMSCTLQPRFHADEGMT